MGFIRSKAIGCRRNIIQDNSVMCCLFRNFARFYRTRDQPKNKERALSRLRTFIYDKERQKYDEDIASKRKTMVSTGDRSAKIRTYNYPQGRITDHRINYTVYNLGAFMDGDIQDCIDHLIVAENTERLKASEL